MYLEPCGKEVRRDVFWQSKYLELIIKAQEPNIVRNLIIRDFALSGIDIRDFI